MKVFMGRGATAAAKNLHVGYRILGSNERLLAGRYENVLINGFSLREFDELEHYSKWRPGDTVFVTEATVMFPEGKQIELLFAGG